MPVHILCSYIDVLASVPHPSETALTAGAFLPHNKFLMLAFLQPAEGVLKHSPSANTLICWLAAGKMWPTRWRDFCQCQEFDAHRLLFIVLSQALQERRRH